MFKRIDHVEIITKDMEKTLDYYTRVLGFTLKERLTPRPGSPFKEIVFLRLNDTMLEVIVMNEPAVEPPGYRIMAIEVEDMDQAIEYLKKQGTEISRLPMALGKSRRAEIKDPNGFTIELRQW